MRMRRTIGLSLALLVVSVAAVAKEARSAHDQAVPSSKSKPAKADTIAGKLHGKQQPAHGKPVGELHFDRDLEVVSRIGLVERGRGGLVQRPLVQVPGVHVVDPRA